MKKILSTVLIASAFLFACNSSEQSDTTTESTANPEVQSVPANSAVELPATDNNAAATSMETSTAPGMQQPTTAPAPATAPPTQSTTATAPGMNPPHGEPGHRCEIAVGAPLNSAPATPAPTPSMSPSPSSITPNVLVSPNSPVVGTPQVIQAPSPSTAAPAPTTTTTTAPGMNPP